MALSEIQSKLVTTLNLCGVEQNQLIGIMLMLKNHEKSMIKLGEYIADNYPITEEEIIEKAVEIYQSIPKK